MNSDLDLVLDRVVDAQAALIWHQWTEPKHLFGMVLSQAVAHNDVRDRAQRATSLEVARLAVALGEMDERSESPCLNAFVVARIDHLRWVKDKHPDFDDTMDTILKAAKQFNPGNVKADQVARSGGAPSTEE